MMMMMIEEENTGFTRVEMKHYSNDMLDIDSGFPTTRKRKIQGNELDCLRTSNGNEFFFSNHLTLSIVRNRR